MNKELEDYDFKILKMEKRSVLIQNYNLSQIQNSQNLTQPSDVSRDKSRSIVINKKKNHLKTFYNQENPENLISEEYGENNNSSSLHSSNKQIEQSQESINFEFLRNHNLKQNNIPLKLYLNKF